MEIEYYGLQQHLKFNSAFKGIPLEVKNCFKVNTSNKPKITEIRVFCLYYQITKSNNGPVK